MKIYEVVLDGKRYEKLDHRMLSSGRRIQLAMNQLISGYDLFYDLIDSIYMHVEDGCPLEIVLNESEEELEMLRFMTKQVFPEDEDYFVRQIGKRLNCKKDFAFKIILKI